MQERIIQFGEGNFLRGFAEDFIDTLHRQELYDGSVVIVKPTPRGSLDAFAAQNNRYHLVLRGLEQGQPIERVKTIRCISRCINPYNSFSDYIALAQEPALRFIISNTTEAGIVYDAGCQFSDRPARSFPAKLTQLLYARYRAGLNGFILLPCELIEQNGDALKQCVLQHAAAWRLGEAFADWVNTANHFCNTLVDRIVTGYPTEEAAALCRQIGYEDRLLDAAEPYHLWAIEGNYEAELPLQQAGLNVLWTDNLQPLKARKVRLLNGAHTAIVFPALLLGITTVGGCLQDDDMHRFLTHYLYQCAVPALGDTAENNAFADAVMKRFANPYIRHQLRAIALNSVSKFSVCVLPTAQDYQAAFGHYPRAAALSLAALLYYYKTEQPQDDAQLIDKLRHNSVDEIINSGLFGTVSGMGKAVHTAFDAVSQGRCREATQWAVS